MIFKTIEDSVDKTRSKLILFNKDWETYKKNWEKGVSKSGFIGGIKSIFQSNKTSLSAEQMRRYRDWNNAVKHNVTTQKDYNRILKGATQTERQYYQSLNHRKAVLAELTHATNASTLATKAHSAALKALSIAGNIVAMIAISKAIQLAISAYDNYVHRLDNA